jgi:DNA-binding transcriptional LysR family regulator
MGIDPESLLSRIDLRQLRYFVAVAESRSISAAAERLHLSQPPLSVQIKELESALGTQLLERHRNGITLTDAGRAMLEEARSVLARAMRATQLVQQIGRGEMGEVRIGLVGSIMWTVFPKFLAEFGNRYPQVKWSVHEINQAAQIAALNDHRIDVGLWRGQSQAVEGLRSRKLLKDQIMAVVPAAHALAKQRKLGLVELTRLPYLSMDLGLSSFAQEMIDSMRGYGHVPRIAHVVREPQTLLALAANGLGFTLLAGSLGSIGWPGVVFRPIVERLPAVDVYLHVRDHAPSPVVARFLEVMDEVIALPR